MAGHDMEFDDDVTLITRAWMNEKNSPEILEYEEELVENLMEQVQNQEENIARAQEENSKKDTNIGFLANLYLMDVERIKYLLRSYLRVRIAKIEDHVLAILMSEELINRLSEKEVEYAKGFLDLQEKHFNNSFLNAIPEQFRSLTDDSQGTKMVSQPDLDTHVFIRVLDDVGDYQLEESGEATELKRGDVMIVRYKAVRPLLEASRIELV